MVLGDMLLEDVAGTSYYREQSSTTSSNQMYGVLTTLCIFVPHLPLLCPDSLQDLFGNAADSADRDGGRGKFGYFSFPLSSRGYSIYIYFFPPFPASTGQP